MDSIWTKFVFLMGVEIAVCIGLAIDVMEEESEDCRLPTVKIICEFTDKEIQTASNKLTLTHGGLVLASCQKDTGMCSTAGKRLNVTIDNRRAVMTIPYMDVFYDSVPWACDVGDNSASLKPKYFHAEAERKLLSLKGVSIVDLLTLILVIIILVVLILNVFSTNCCRNKSDKDKSESFPCPCGWFCNRKKEEPAPKGYTGKRYEVKTSYVVDDPNVIPDAKYKDGRDRKTEAELVCKNVTEADKEVIAEKLTEWTDARKPLVSTSGDAGV